MPQKSAVAGIIDGDGNFRVVVTERWRMRHHVGKDERLFVVPKLRVQEPVSLGNVPALIELVQKHIEEWVRMRNEPLPSAISEYLRRK